MASRWTWNVVDQQVARALEDDKGKELDQLYYALRSRTVLLYLMFHLRELIMLARAIRFWLVVIALILIVSLFSTWVIRFGGTITPTARSHAISASLPRQRPLKLAQRNATKRNERCFSFPAARNETQRGA